MPSTLCCRLAVIKISFVVNLAAVSFLVPKWEIARLCRHAATEQKKMGVERRKPPGQYCFETPPGVLRYFQISGTSPPVGNKFQLRAGSK